MYVYVLYRNPNRWRDLVEMAGRFLGVFQPSTPPGMECLKEVQGVSGATAVHFGKNFIKQKLQGTPDLVGAGHLFGPQIWIRKDLGPLSFWSHGHSLWRIAYKIKVASYVPNSYLVRLDTLYLDPQGPGGLKGGPSGVLEPQGCILAKTL